MSQWFEHNRLPIIAVTHIVAFAVTVLSTAFIRPNMHGALWMFIVTATWAAVNLALGLYTMHRIERGDK